jgi:hypothetical protein
MTPLDRLAVFVHPGVLCALAQPVLVDDTIAGHHYIVADLLYCTLCGGRPQVLDQVLAHQNEVGLATVLCLPCRATDPNRKRLRAKLEARYDPARFASPGAIAARSDHGL